MMRTDLLFAVACQHLAAKYYRQARKWRAYCDDWGLNHRDDIYYRAYEEATETAMLYSKTARLYMGVEE
jgi:hypothetical protein